MHIDRSTDHDHDTFEEHVELASAVRPLDGGAVGPLEEPDDDEVVPRGERDGVLGVVAHAAPLEDGDVVAVAELEAVGGVHAVVADGRAGGDEHAARGLIEGVVELPHEAVGRAPRAARAVDGVGPLAAVRDPVRVVARERRGARAARAVVNLEAEAAEDGGVARVSEHPLVEAQGEVAVGDSDAVLELQRRLAEAQLAERADRVAERPLLRRE